jgi:cytochrome o ubiquinol oxidase subunit 3
MSFRTDVKKLPYIDDPILNKIAAYKIFGFWIYLMSDCVLFATLFVTFFALSSSYLDAQYGKKFFDLKEVLIETGCLLSSSFTFGLSVLALQASSKKKLIICLIATILLGSAFLCFELKEFYKLILEGYGPDKNAFFSAFFTLLGTHGLHVLIGLIWIIFMVSEVIRKGFSLTLKYRLMILSFFWHFLDIIWICIFTLVYLMGFLK